MDGIALFARDSFGATDTTPVTLLPGQFAEVDTGDPIPEGCDAVIMVEELVKNDDGSVTIHAPAAPWQHIRQIGEDICAGEMILPSFMEITPAAIGALIAGGVLEAEVLAKPVVGIIPTGDEIVPPCADPKPGDILEFNSSIFSAMVSSWGAKAKTYPIVPDRYDEIRDALQKASDECDMVLLNAGSSAGRDDYSAAAVREVGQVRRARRLFRRRRARGRAGSAPRHRHQARQARHSRSARRGADPRRARLSGLRHHRD